MSFYPRQGLWRKRLLYILAGCGVFALAGLIFLIYLALQVPVDRLAGEIPFPRVATTFQKTEPIPQVDTAKPDKPPTLIPEAGNVPAYALFYAAQPAGQERIKPEKHRSRPYSKPEKRTSGAVKAKRSS
ncbi:hypothetical protein [Desulfobacca acetoxidans]|uniref:Uncharacterized protein n=1 Tax=Desulfobacca acetoxidans (strain ATCC 700848 / DSM 11109 / ASRB2) TaxID=880072 RepID=F2NIG9_DESAR|nr:hypothetical protein [Desulfobacca acetoxidans]AEB10371.1 hypothetical protein Desac_2553 [Desulfobacca acetoxidans DSM 11109]